MEKAKVNNLVMKNAWRKAEIYAAKNGGKKSDYISECLKEQWQLIKKAYGQAEIYIILYNKRDDSYAKDYAILGVLPEIKTNKNGYTYLKAYTYKGERNYSYYTLVKVKNLKEAKEKLETLQNAGYILS